MSALRSLMLLLLLLPMLNGCGIDNPGFRIGALVLLPVVLVILVLWLLLARGGEEDWEKKHEPDEEDDRDDYLM